VYAASGKLAEMWPYWWVVFLIVLLIVLILVLILCVCCWMRRNRGDEYPGTTCSARQSVSDDGKYFKYVCITTNQPDNESNPNPKPTPTSKQHAAVSIQLNIVACPTYTDIFTRDSVVAPFLLLFVVVVTAAPLLATVIIMMNLS